MLAGRAEPKWLGEKIPGSTVLAHTRPGGHNGGMGKKHAFEHESLQDRESIVAYLEALTAGLRAGRIHLSQGETELELHPTGLLTLSVRAARKRERTRLDLRVSWRAGETSSEEGEALRIEGGSE